jgi:hypothetical protein
VILFYKEMYKNGRVTAVASYTSMFSKNSSRTLYIIYQLFYKSFYYSINTEGVKVLPRKEQDSQYHIEGMLGYAERTEVKSLFSSALPLLHAGGKHHKIILAPLMRYARNSCCTDPLHLTNRQDLGLNMGTLLNKAEKWLRDLSYMKRIRNYLVVNPSSILAVKSSIVKSAKSVSKFWKKSPVHMTPDGYQLLADSILEDIPDMAFIRPETTEVAEETAQSPVPAPPTTPAPVPRGTARYSGKFDSRKEWVRPDDAIVHRASDSTCWNCGRDSYQARGRGGQRPHTGLNRGRGQFRGKSSHWDKRVNRGGRHRPY